jgi:uncharacterized protein (TIRG00374 family)
LVDKISRVSLDPWRALINNTTSVTTKTLLRFFLALAFLGLMLLAFGWWFREDFPWASLLALPWSIPLMGFGAYLLMHLVEGLKLRALLGQLGHRLGFWPAVYNALGGFLFTGITPMAAGGQAFQIAHLARHCIPRGEAMNVILGRIPQHVFTSFLTIVLGAPLLLNSLETYLSWELGLMSLGLAVSLFSAIMLFLILRGAKSFHRWIFRLLFFLPLPIKKKILRAWYSQKPSLMELQTSFRRLWSHRLGFMLWDSIVSWLITMGQGLSLYGVFVLFGLEMDLLTVLYLYVLLGMVVFFVPTPGASGSMELAYASLMGGQNFFPTLIAVLGWRVGTYYLQLLLAGILIFTGWNQRGVGKSLRTVK